MERCQNENSLMEKGQMGNNLKGKSLIRNSLMVNSLMRNGLRRNSLMVKELLRKSLTEIGQMGNGLKKNSLIEKGLMGNGVTRASLRIKVASCKESSRACIFTSDLTCVTSSFPDNTNLMTCLLFPNKFTYQHYSRQVHHTLVLHSHLPFDVCRHQETLVANILCFGQVSFPILHIKCGKFNYLSIIKYIARLLFYKCNHEQLSGSISAPFLSLYCCRPLCNRFIQFCGISAEQEYQGRTCPGLSVCVPQGDDCSDRFSGVERWKR